MAFNPLVYLKFEGAQGATATVDSSSYNRTVTRAGAPIIDQVDPALGISSSYFPDPTIAGNIASWNIAPSTDFGNANLWLHPDGFTLRARMKFEELTDSNGNVEVICAWYQNAFSHVVFGRVQFLEGSDLRHRLALFFRAGAPAGTNIKSTLEFNPTLNQWYTLEVSKFGNDYTFKVDFDQFGSVVTNAAANYPDPTSVTLVIGGSTSLDNVTSNQSFQGWLDEVIITNGQLASFLTDGASVDGAAYCPFVTAGQARKMITSLSGLDHLEGEDIEVQADGLPIDSTFTVSSGAITLPNRAAVVHAGLPYDGKIKLLKASDGNPGGSGQMKMRRIYGGGFRVFRSQIFKVGLDDDHMDPIAPEDRDLITPALPLISGDIKKAPDTTWDNESQLQILVDSPVPVFLLAIIAQSEVENP